MYSRYTVYQTRLSLREYLLLLVSCTFQKFWHSYDAVIYARALGERTPGTHTLNLIEDADHNFTGRQDEITDAILDWWALHQRNELATGLWLAGVRGKL